MISSAFAIAFLFQQATTPSDLPPAPPVAAEEQADRAIDASEDYPGEAGFEDDGGSEFADETGDEIEYNPDVDPSTLNRIYVKDSSEAMRVEIVHPLQPICVRKMMVGSRVKARTFCQDQTSWVAHAAAMDAMIDSWANTGVPLEEGGDATPGKSFGQGR